MVRFAFRAPPYLMVAAAAIVSPAVAAPEVRNPADLGTAVSAQIACAEIFVNGRTEPDVLRDDVHALAPFTRDVTLSVKSEQRSVTASAPGATPRTALFRPAVGCTLLTDGVTAVDLEKQATGLTALSHGGERPWGNRDSRSSAKPDRTAAIERALTAAFNARNVKGYPDTRAILVVQGGKIVAERYAPGFDRNHRFLGWSATKSIVGTLVGMLVDDGKLKLDAPAPIAEWQGATDPRHAITLRQLMNMTSGLAFAEPYRPGSDSMKMLFEVPNMASVAIDRPVEHPPGTFWSYSSGTSNLLSEIVFRATGGTLQGMTRFAQTRLFQPLGMKSAMIEPDASGVLVGSSYGYATARDWARFALLYLHDGKSGGKRLLSHDWIDFVRISSQDARPFYSGQFWRNRTDATGPKSTYFKDLPDDAFMAMGHNGQMTMVIPSRDAVIVRLGWTPEGQAFDFNTFLAPIVAALPKSAPAR